MKNQKSKVKNEKWSFDIIFTHNCATALAGAKAMADAGKAKGDTRSSLISVHCVTLTANC